MTRATYERLAPRYTDVARVVNDIRDGKVDAGGSFAMLDGTSLTEITDLRLTEQSVLVLSPRSPDAANIAWWVVDKGRGKMTIGHDAVAGDLAFDWLALG
jgi:hypothetical protein